MSDSGDGRNLSGSAQAALRQRGARLLQAGHTHAEIAQLLAVGLRTVAGWSARLRVSGLEGMGERRRGRRPGEQAALSEIQQAQIVQTMKGSNPDQLELGEGVLWSRGAVRALIVRMCEVSLTRQSVGRYLRRWGLSAKKPAKRWAEQDPKRVAAWIKQEYRGSEGDRR